jgi:predicted transcriptional regulator
MARPKTKGLTERELEIMHILWQRGELTAAEVREALAREGRDLAYTTVATLVRILHKKGLVVQCNRERPFRFRPARSFDDVSRSMVGDLVQRWFRGSREQLLLRLFDEKELTPKERELLTTILKEKSK